MGRGGGPPGEAQAGNDPGRAPFAGCIGAPGGDVEPIGWPACHVEGLVGSGSLAFGCVNVVSSAGGGTLAWLKAAS